MEMVMAEVISQQQLAFERGRKRYLAGAPCPPKPRDDCSELDVGMWLWVGWRLELASDWMGRCRVAETLDLPPPDFPAA